MAVHGRRLLTIAGLGALISLLRHNGLFVVVLMFAGLLVAFPAQRRRVALSAAAIVAVFYLVRGPLETALGVPPTSRYYLLANQTHQIAAMLSDGVELTPSQAALLTAVMPLEKWKSTYDCYSVIPTMTAGNASVVEQQFESYVKAFRSLAVQRPLILLKQQICVSTLVWNVRPAPLFAFYPGIVTTLPVRRAIRNCRELGMSCSGSQTGRLQPDGVSRSSGVQPPTYM